MLIVLAAVFGPTVLTPYDPIVPDLTNCLVGPSPEFILGTDEVGRDIWSRLLSGLRPSLVAGLAAVAVAAISGTVFGLTSGYFGGVYAAVVMRIMDVLLAWPTIFLALAIVLVFGPGQLNVILAIAVAETPTFARLIRSVTIQHLHAEHVEAADRWAPQVRGSCGSTSCRSRRSRSSSNWPCRFPRPSWRRHR